MSIKEDGMVYHKYSKAFICICVLIALVFTATCGLQPVSSIRVKASPKFCLPLGAKSITEDEVFKIVEGTVSNGNKNIRLYRYQPSGDDKLHYLVHYPLQTLELDISKYFNGDPLGNGGGTSGGNAALSQNFNNSISVPSLKIDENVSINVSTINEKLLTKFNTGDPISVSIPSGIAPIPSHTLPVNVSFTDFTTIAFENGAKLTLSSSSSGVSYTITAAKMKKSDGTFVSGTISPDRKKIEFSLDDITISNTVSFQLTLNLTSGSGAISLSTKLDGVIKEVTGVNASDIDVSLPSQSITLPLPAEFEKATIAEGFMKFTVQMPHEWSNITIKEKMQVVQSGTDGFSITPSDYRPLGVESPLKDQKLNNQSSLSYTPVFKVTLNNATYTKQDSLPVTLALDIKKFKEITLKNPSGLTVERKQNVPQDMKDWVKKIKFKKVSATIKLDNGLPAGNPIKIKLSSACFKMAEQEKTFSSKYEAGFEPKDSEQVYQGGSNFNLNINSSPLPAGEQNITEFDLKAQVILPTDGSIPDTFTLKNIETGKDITLSGSIHFDPDWDEITLKKINAREGSFPESDFQDLSQLTSKLQTAGIKLEEIPVSFYAGSDVKLPNTTITVKLEAQYHKQDNSFETKKLVDGTIDSLKTLPAGTFPSDNKILVNKKLPDPMFQIKEGESGGETSLMKIMNAYSKDLKLSYKLSMDEMTITKANYQEYKEKYKDKNPKVSVDLVLDVPMAFKADGTKKPSLQELVGRDIPINDLFFRKTKDDKLFGIEQIPSNALKAVAVHVQLENGLNASSLSPNLVLKFKKGSDFIKADGADIEKKLTADAGEQTVRLTYKELNVLLKEYPVLPELLLELPEGQYSLKPNFKLVASISVSAEMDIDHKIK